MKGNWIPEVGLFRFRDRGELSQAKYWVSLLNENCAVGCIMESYNSKSNSRSAV